MINSVNYLGFSVLDMEYVDARKYFNKGSILTISPNSYGITTKNRAFKKALTRNGLLVLDGVYFGLGYFLKTGKRMHKNQGPEIFYKELLIQQRKGGKVFFLGSSVETLKKITQRIKNEYPNIKYDSYSPPFKSEFDVQDNHSIFDRIVQFNPDVVFVGMTCPKQEIWVDENTDKFRDILFIAIGGVFDWFAGNYKEINPIWWKLRIGWLVRMIQRPEIFKRNIKNILIYLKDMLNDSK